MLVIIITLVLLFIGKAMLEEKYCYNTGFTLLDSSGIKLGDVSPELRNKGISPLQVGSTNGYKEWEDAYVECYKNFDLFKINISILNKSYTAYTHFIDW